MAQNDKSQYHRSRNRWYNPSLMQWMSPDPIGYDGGDVNLYRFVGNDPVNRVDPSGLISLNPIAAYQQAYEDFVCSKPGGCLNLKFTDHFLHGGGAPTSFTELGVRYAFENTNGFQSLLGEVKSEISDSKSCSGSNKKDWNITNEIFSIGKFTAEYTWACAGSSCKIFMSVNDPFVDPYRLYDYFMANMPSFGESADGNDHTAYGVANLDNSWNPLYNLGGNPYDIYEQLDFTTRK